MVDSKKQDMKMIISLSLIIHYAHYCHPNENNVVKIQGYVWLWMLNIYQIYVFVITIMAWSLFQKNSRISSKILKTEGLGKNQIVYMKLIKIQSCHMGVIFKPKHMIWQRQQCVHTHSQIMRYHTGNVYCYVLPNFQALILLTRKQMINIPTLLNQFIFTFIIWL